MVRHPRQSLGHGLRGGRRRAHRAGRQRGPADDVRERRRRRPGRGHGRNPGPRGRADPGDRRHHHAQGGPVGRQPARDPDRVRRTADRRRGGPRLGVHDLVHGGRLVGTDGACLDDPGALAGRHRGTGFADPPAPSPPVRAVPRWGHRPDPPRAGARWRARRHRPRQLRSDQQGPGAGPGDRRRGARRDRASTPQPRPGPATPSRDPAGTSSGASSQARSTRNRPSGWANGSSRRSGARS